MAEGKPNTAQSCGEVTENKAASFNITQPKEEKECDTNTIEESQKYNQDVQQVGNQAQGEGEHKECCKDQGLTNQKKENTEQNEDIVQKQLEKNSGQEEKKSGLTENGVKKDNTDPVENECQGEKNDKPEEKNTVDGMTAQSEKEKSQEEEKQGHSKSEEQSFQEPCLQNEKKEEQDEDMKGNQREKGQEQEEYTGEPGGKKSEVTKDHLEDTAVNIEQVQKNENQGENNDEPEEKNIQADEATAACEKEKSQVDKKAREPREQVKEGENDVEPEENVQKGGKGSQDISDHKRAETTEADQQETRTAKKKEKFRFGKKRPYITIKTGNTLDTHEEFLKRLHSQKATLKLVDKEQRFKFILVFCPVVSRAGTDIEAALCQLKKISDTKPAVLVVLHCTNDPECVVSDSSRAVSRDKMIVVDCLFSEDNGLHECKKNEAALCKVIKWLKAKPWR